MRVSLILLVAVVLLAGPIAPSSAKGRKSVDDLLADAKACEEEGDVLDAARAIGRAAHLAHDHGDLLEEARAGGALDRLLRRAKDSWLATAAATIEELDAKRAGAYVSAHALAREVLLVSSRSGDRTGVPVAARALSAFASDRHRGKAAEAVASFGRGLLLLTDGERADEMRKEAEDALAASLASCVEEHWFETAAAVGTELAVLRLAAGNADGAREALALTAKAIEDAGGYPDLQVLIVWSNTVRVRLPDAPKNVLAPHEAALRPLHGGRAEPGGAGAPAGGEPSVLGKKWKRLGARTNLVTVEREGTGSRVRLAYVRKHGAERSFRTGQRILVVDGIGLRFHGHAVSLAGIDLAVIPGASGGGPCREGFHAWYLLADGETWALRKDGRVSVR